MVILLSSLMRYKRSLICFSLILFLFSCVPNKNLVYLQEGQELKDKKQILVDTVLRTHSMVINEYRIQPLDILTIKFESLTSDEYDFFSKVDPQQAGGMGGAGQAFLAMTGILVDPNGEIEYPVVGKIKLEGLTVFEAQEKMQKIASQYVRDVIVRIRLLNFRFTILGEVNQEQTVTSYNTRLTMMEAVGMAGGFGELADRSRVKIIRQKGNISEVYYINLLEEQYVESSYYYVQQNDIIIVSPLAQRSYRKYFTQNLGVLTGTLSAVSSILLVVTLLLNESAK